MKLRDDDGNLLITDAKELSAFFYGEAIQCGHQASFFSAEADMRMLDALFTNLSISLSALGVYFDTIQGTYLETRLMELLKEPTTKGKDKSNGTGKPS